LAGGTGGDGLVKTPALPPQATSLPGLLSFTSLLLLGLLLLLELLLWLLL
jgi:hypothetical protein